MSYDVGLSRMSGSTRRKLRSEIICERSLDDASEGTSARTRPLSYDEIMLKRKGKKELECFREGAREAEGSGHGEIARHTDNRSKDSNAAAMKNSRDYAREASSRKKEEKNSRMEDTQNKSKNKEGRDSENRSKHRHEKDARIGTEALKNDRRSHGRSRLDEHSRDNARYDYEKKRGRDSVAQDRYMERSEGASERENKRKDRSGDDEKHRIRDPVKKRESGSRRDLEISENKEKVEYSRSRHDETRSKRRRSRSQERTKDKGRRSSSSSPKSQKNVSAHGHDRGELASSSQRDTSRRHSDVDRSKMSSNGSSSHHRRHGGSSSGLGGYSPRKRKTEAAVKTPSPIRSPERKSAGWDHPPSGANINLSSSVTSGTQLDSQTKSSTMIELAADASVATSMGQTLSAILSHSMSAFKEASIDSVQLTQATRPMRRLYIDNIPGPASEKDIMECFNTFLLSTGFNHIRGTRPCISCMIHKEKRQALVEFLTPEDASAALAFDGRSLFGSILKIRRPKDFVEVLSGSSEKPRTGDDTISDVAISDVVKDSHNKIFVGGIAEGLSSEMIMEIVSAFGSLKAYHFEINEDLNEPCAFLEYADHSVTLRACAGLNGMKLGGRVLTVAQAVPNTESMENSGSKPFYGIPEHVKPLLQRPTEVLKLSNVLDKKSMELLSETDLEEIVEDVRLECSRFGSIVSINVVKAFNAYTVISEAKEVLDMETFQPLEEREFHCRHLNVDSMEVAVDHGAGDGSESEPSTNVEGFDVIGGVEEGDKHESTPATANPGVEVGAAGTSTVEEVKEADSIVPLNCDDKADNDPQEIDVIGCSAMEDADKPNDSAGTHQEIPVEEGGGSYESDPEQNMGIGKPGDGETPSIEDLQVLDKTNGKLQEEVLLSNDSETKNLKATENGFTNEKACRVTDMFEVGCVLVEFRRAEASCMAAHCLHGRIFDNRVVSVEYVPLKAYRERFPK